MSSSGQVPSRKYFVWILSRYHHLCSVGYWCDNGNCVPQHALAVVLLALFLFGGLTLVAGSDVLLGFLCSYAFLFVSPSYPILCGVVGGYFFLLQGVGRPSLRLVLHLCSCSGVFLILVGFWCLPVALFKLQDSVCGEWRHKVELLDFPSNTNLPKRRKILITPYGVIRHETGLD